MLKIKIKIFNRNDIVFKKEIKLFINTSSAEIFKIFILIYTDGCTFLRFYSKFDNISIGRQWTEILTRLHHLIFPKTESYISDAGYWRCFKVKGDRHLTYPAYARLNHPTRGHNKRIYLDLDSTFVPQFLDISNSVYHPSVYRIGELTVETLIIGLILLISAYFLSI